MAVRPFPGLWCVPPPAPAVRDVPSGQAPGPAEPYGVRQWAAKAAAGLVVRSSSGSSGP